MVSNEHFLVSVHNFSSISLVFKPTTTVSQGLRSRSLDSSRSLRSMVHYQANMNRGDNVMKKREPKRYSTATQDVYPVRDTYKKKKLIKIDVRHTKEYNKFNSKFSFVLNCDSGKCPLIQERLERHKAQHHHQQLKREDSATSSKNLRERGINVSPTLSRLRLPRFTLPRLNDDKDVQTEMTLLKDSIFQQDNVPNMINYIKHEPLTNSEIRDNVHKINVYKNQIQNEILNWLQCVPIFFSLDFTSQYLKENILNVFVDKVERLSPQAHTDSYNENLRKEIDDCLNVLPIWLPNSQQDQSLFKKGLREKLFNNILKLNTKHLNMQFKIENIKANKEENKNKIYIGEEKDRKPDVVEFEIQTERRNRNYYIDSKSETKETNVNNIKEVKQLTNEMQEINKKIPIESEDKTPRNNYIEFKTDEEDEEARNREKIAELRKVVSQINALNEEKRNYFINKGLNEEMAANVEKNVRDTENVGNVEIFKNYNLTNENLGNIIVGRRGKNYKETTKLEDDDVCVKEINNWLANIHFRRPVSKRHIINLVLKKISPLLNTSIHATNYKLKLRGAILEVLNELPIHLVHPKNRIVCLNRFAAELANRLMIVQIKASSKRRTVLHQCTSQIIGVPMNNSYYKQIITEKVSKVLSRVKLCNRNDIKEEICDAIFNSSGSLRAGIENKICDILLRACTLDKAQNVAKMIKRDIKIALKQDKVPTKVSSQSIRQQRSGVISIYSSKGIDPITSTPKQPTKKYIPKLNPEEQSYMEKVAALVRAWMEMLPTKFNDDKNYKEIITYDLAGDIMDEVKREQLSPETDTQKDKNLNYFMYRWLVRFEIFDDVHDAKPFIAEFLKKLKEIPVPELTAPQHGTRQAMQNLKLIERDFDWEEDFVARGIDVLEDQISVWMNEQPSEIYATDNKNTRNKMVKDLALTLQDRLRNKSPETEIEEDINQWLHKVINPNEKEHIGLLVHNLREKIINVPQDETLEARNEKKRRQRAEFRQNDPSGSAPLSDNVSSRQEDPDETIKEFILKYIQHNYDIDDPMARGAFAQLLKTEMRKLNPPTRKEVYSNFSKAASHEEFRPEKFINELEYIEMISDWLKNIPINPLYNTPGNRPRVDFVNDLAKNILEVEEQRKANPNAMDFDLYISSVINQSIRTYNLPIMIEHKDNIPLMVSQLLSKINAHRAAMTQNDSSISDIKEQNISEFIEDYIRINGREIAEDEVKLEAWTARLLTEVKKMLHDGADPSSLCKVQVYERFSKIPLPAKESVKRFSLQISYVKEISDWLKNLPLLPANTSGEQEKRINMISELSEQISQREAKKTSDPNDNSADKELVEYITNWIPKLSLDSSKHLIIPILIQQLMNRIEKVNRRDQTLSDGSQLGENSSLNDKAKKDPGTQIVEFIESWCNKLPVEGEDQAAIQTIKDDIARKLYQKIGELNIDARIYNDDLIYKDLLEDELDTQLENLPQNSELQNNREKLKAELLDTIVAMKKEIKEKFAGDDYKHKLETTINAAIPHPVQSRQTIEPGFEMYKNHLANMFILENFDHSNEEVKVKYERRIRNEVDKYFESAQNKNALPMTKDQMYNELYGELFKVPMPNEESVIDEIETVKTRCEVDAWFEELPLREAENINEQLEWDQILSTLAKRLHDIEKNESEPDEKIRKQINKWLSKLPLLPGQESNIEKYIDKLQNALKSSAETRKYVPKDQSKGKSIPTPKVNKSLNTSQVPGPSSNGELSHRSTAEPTSSSESLVSKPYNQITPTPYKSPGDLIVEIVEDWCNQLPLIGTQAQNKIMKDDISTKIVMKICELNMDPEIFNDDIVYDQLLDEELEKNMKDLPVCCTFGQSKPARKYQLKDMIRSIKTLIKEEKERYEYRTELNNTVANILNDHENTPEKEAEFNKLKDEIVENFVQYNYNKDDDDAKLIYKRNVHNTVVRYISDVKDKGEQVNPLVKRNQLICELSKIPVPNNTILKEEVQEIKMKYEVEQLFNDNNLDDNTEKTAQMKKTLTKRLNNIEKSGHTSSNDNKMKAEIAKCLKKVDKDVSLKVIEDFVMNLKNSEPERKHPPVNNSLANQNDKSRRQSDGTNPNVPTLQTPSPGPRGGYQTNQTTPQRGPQQNGQYLDVPPMHDQSHCCHTKSGDVNTPQATLAHPGSGYQQSGFLPQTEQQRQQSGQFLQVPDLSDESHCCPEPQWYSLEPATPLPYQSTGYNPSSFQQIETGVAEVCCSPPGSNDQYQRENFEDIRDPYMRSTGSPSEPTSLEFPGHLRQISSHRVGSEFGIDKPNDYGNYEGGMYGGPQNFLPGNISEKSGRHNLGNASPYQSTPEDNSDYQVYDKSWSLYPPGNVDQTQGQFLKYEDFKKGSYVNSSMAPQEYAYPDQPDSDDSRSGNEAPNYRHIATPRRVQGEAQTFEPSPSQQDDTPESLYRAPVFDPQPLYSPITVPTRNSSVSANLPTRTCRPPWRRDASTGQRRRSKYIEPSDNERYRCVCDKRMKIRSGPYCMIPIEEYCDDCGGFNSVWCRMPMPGCINPMYL